MTNFKNWPDVIFPFFGNLHYIEHNKWKTIDFYEVEKLQYSAGFVISYLIKMILGVKYKLC